jgi:quinol monooxygenase YgiN
MNSSADKQKEVMQTLLSMIESSESQQGCQSFEIYQNIDKKSIFCLLEEWATREDLICHLKSKLFGALLGARTLLEEPFKIQIFTVSHIEKKEILESANILTI